MVSIFVVAGGRCHLLLDLLLDIREKQHGRRQLVDHHACIQRRLSIMDHCFQDNTPHVVRWITVRQHYGDNIYRCHGGFQPNNTNRTPLDRNRPSGNRTNSNQTIGKQKWETYS